MYYLVYISSAVKPMNYDDLSALLQQCRDNNQKLGITGMLLYQNGTFLQLLEGEQQVVMDLYNTISKDHRHTAIHTVLDGEIAERNFPDWSMGFFNMDKAGEFPQYSEFIDEKLELTSFKQGTQDVYNFIVQFNKLVTTDEDK